MDVQDIIAQEDSSGDSHKSKGVFDDWYHNYKNKMVKEMIRETNIQPTSSHPLVIADRKNEIW